MSDKDFEIGDKVRFVSYPDGHINEVSNYLNTVVTVMDKHSSDLISVRFHDGNHLILDVNEVEFVTEEKINIEDLYSAFTKFQASMQLAQYYKRNLQEWNDHLMNAQEEFKKAIGRLADHIDWTEK